MISRNEGKIITKLKTSRKEKKKAWLTVHDLHALGHSPKEKPLLAHYYRMPLGLGKFVPGILC